jgi:ATP-binding cassette, subfamily B, bacterial
MMVRDRTFVAVLQAVFQNTVSIGTGVILVLAAGSLATSAGQAGLTIGQFALFVYMLVMVTDSAYFIGLFLARVKQAGVSIERMMGMMQGASWEDLATVADLGLADRPAGAPATNGGPLTPGTDLLSVRGLTFRHPTSGLGIDRCRRGHSCRRTGRGHRPHRGGQDDPAAHDHGPAARPGGRDPLARPGRR